MEEKKVLKSVAGTVLEEGVDFFIDVNNQNILHRLRILPKAKHFTIKPLVLGTMIRVSEEIIDLVTVSEADLKGRSYLDVGAEQIIANRDRMVNIIALAITNSESKPPKSLTAFLRKNLTANEMMEILKVVTRQLDVKSFLSSIMSVKGMSLLNPKE
jgi:hypothetical protein